MAEVAGAGALPERFARYLAGLRDLEATRPRLGRYPGLSSTPWHDSADVPFARDLVAHADALLAELGGVPDDLFAREAEPIARTGSWDVAFLRERGRRNDEFAARCPLTTSLIERHRTVRGPAGLAYLSRLRPGTHVAAHTGPTNLRLRCHFGIRVAEECGIAVGGERRTWSRGGVLVFDDSFVHEAWNDGGADRVVLVVDVWHPELTDDEVVLLEGLDRLVVARAENVARYWAANDRPAEVSA